ncbi:RidA family protein [Virgibacillus xinjiangensis]|uniref:RidA family protein n=1 Tax=Virgibacillus xinjiangensis TaxID=393090 RepID=A0ABV7CTE8_9BACI
MKKRIQTDNAPAPTGPYSQAILEGGFVFISGQDGIHPNGESAGETIALQTEAALRNIESILKEAGGSLENLVFVTCHLDDLTEEKANEFNQAYRKYFNQVEKKPARITVGSQLLDGKVEITAIASIDR